MHTTLPHTPAFLVRLLSALVRIRHTFGERQQSANPHRKDQPNGEDATKRQGVADESAESKAKRVGAPVQFMLAKNPGKALVHHEHVVGRVVQKSGGIASRQLGE